MSYSIGIDLGGTNIKYGLVDISGNIINQGLRPTKREGKSFTVIDELKRTISDQLDFATEKRINIAGIGIGVPALVEKGYIIGCSGNLPEIERLQLGNMLAEYFNRDVFIENDANLMGLGEFKFGAARGLSEVVFLTVGTGIGGSLILNGKLYGGYRNRGTEFGHICISLSGPSCSCGGIGCLEALASVQALIRSYSHLLTDEEIGLCKPINGRLIIDRYLKNEEAAVLAMKRHFDYLASGVASLINIFSPQKVIIGGGITESGSFYVDQISKRALLLAMKDTALYTQIEPALLGNKAGFMGAAAMVFDQLDIENKM